MLKFLRNDKVKKKIFLGLAVVLVLSFGLTGLLLNEPGHKKESATAVGTFDGKTLSAQDFLASANAVRHQAQIMYGEHFALISQNIDFRSQALDRLLLVEEAKRLKLHVSDAEVVQWLGTQPFFNDKGRFETAIYTRYVRQVLRTEPRQFEEEIRQMLLIQKLREKKGMGLTVTDAEVEQAYRESLEKVPGLTEDETETEEKVFDAKKFEDEKEIWRREALENKTDTLVRNEAAALRKRFVPNPQRTDLDF